MKWKGLFAANSKKGIYKLGSLKVVSLEIVYGAIN
jgi:hypothetical protein